MANIQSQIKRNRQNEKRRLRNRDFRGAARSAVRDALASMASGQEAESAITAALSALDKAARKGSIHQRNAARRKGRLMKRLAAMGLHPQAAQPRVPAADQAAAKPHPAEQKQPARTAKAATPAPEAKTKPEAKKPVTKAAAKKPAAKKSTKK